MKRAAQIGGVGAILVDDVFRVAELPRGADLPQPGTKKAASGDAVNDALRQWTAHADRDQHEQRVGGPVPVALLYARALGAESRFVGAVGRDASGILIRRFLAEHGLTTAYVQDRPGNSGRSVLWINPRGERSVLFSDATLAPIDPQHTEPTFLAGLDLLHIDGREPIAAFALADAMKSQGRPVYYDVGNWKPTSARLLDVATHVQFPLRSAAAYAGRSPESLTMGNDAARLAERIRREHGLEFVVITDGEHGVAFSARGSSPQTSPSYLINAVDTNGAGDVFAGAMGWAIANNYALPQAISLANAAAGWKCQHNGHVMPTLTDLSTFMRTTRQRSSIEGNVL